MLTSFEDVVERSPKPPLTVLNWRESKRKMDWVRGDEVIVYPDLPVFAFQKYKDITESIFIPARVPKPIRPAHKAKKGTVARFAGNLARIFPAVADISDDELEETVRSARSKSVD